MSKQMGEMRLKLTNQLNIRYMVTSLISLYRWDEIDLHTHIWASQTLQSSLEKEKKKQTNKQTDKDNKDNIFIIRDIKLRGKLWG